MTFVSAEAQTISDVVSHAVKSVPEEGSSHLIDDGWAETQKRVESICTQLVDLSIAVDVFQNRVASDLAELCPVRVVPDVARNSSLLNVGFSH